VLSDAQVLTARNDAFGVTATAEQRKSPIAAGLLEIANHDTSQATQKRRTIAFLRNIIGIIVSLTIRRLALENEPGTLS
jgi:hypothetical protein